MQTFKDTQTNQVWQFEDDVLVRKSAAIACSTRRINWTSRWTFPRRSNRSTSTNSARRRSILWRDRRPPGTSAVRHFPVLTSQVRAGAKFSRSPFFRIPADWR